MKTLNCIGGETGKIEFQNERCEGGPIPTGVTFNERESKELFVPMVAGKVIPLIDYKSLIINGVDYVVTKRYVCSSAEHGAVESDFADMRDKTPCKINPKVTIQGITKVVAIHCTKCGILVGYRRYDVDMLCVNCGQTLLSERVS